MINLDEQLSENFTMREMCYSETATAKMWLNVAGHREADNLRRLVRCTLQPLRDYLKTPLHVRSGYRTQQLNKHVGGARNSLHLSGCAADVKMADWAMAFRAAGYVIDCLPFTELIVSRKGLAIWLHIAYDPSSPKHTVSFKQY